MRFRFSLVLSSGFSFLSLSFSLAFFTASANALETRNSDWQAYARAGSEALVIGDFNTARSSFERALANKPEQKSLPHLQIGFAQAILSQGNIKEAAKEVKKAVSQAKSISGLASIDYAESLDLEGWLYQANGKMDDAISCLKDSVKIFEDLSKESGKSTDLGDAYEHLGLLYDTVGLWDLSSENYRKALEVRKELCGANSVEVADLYESIGRIEFRRGHQEDARQMFANALRIKESRGQTWRPYAPEPTERVVIFRFLPGAKNCSMGSANGVEIEQINANGITVELGLSQKPSEFAKTTRALVRITNTSQYDVDVLSQPPKFIQVTPQVQILDQIPAEELANKIEKKGQSKAKWIKFWGADAMTHEYAYSNTQGRGTPPVYGYLPGAFGFQPMPGYGGNNFNRNRWSTSSSSFAMVPDYQKRAEAYAKASEAEMKSKADAANVRVDALGPNRLPPGSQVQGSLDFQLSKYKSAICRIPIGNAVFEFHFER